MTRPTDPLATFIRMAQGATTLPNPLFTVRDLQFSDDNPTGKPFDRAALEELEGLSRRLWQYRTIASVYLERATCPAV